MYNLEYFILYDSHFYLIFVVLASFGHELTGQPHELDCVY
jgi:hypothetical protein